MEKTCPAPFFCVTQDKTSPKEGEQRSLRSHREIFFLTLVARLKKMGIQKENEIRKGNGSLQPCRLVSKF